MSPVNYTHLRGQVQERLINPVQVDIVSPHMSATTSASTRNSDFVLCRLCMQTSAVCISKQFIRSVIFLAKLNIFAKFPTVRPNPGVGLDKSPHQTKIKFSFMASLHTFLSWSIHSHTFKSSLFQLLSKYNSANQLPKLLRLCEFSSARSAMIRSQILST